MRPTASVHETRERYARRLPPVLAAAGALLGAVAVMRTIELPHDRTPAVAVGTAAAVAGAVAGVVAGRRASDPAERHEPRAAARRAASLPGLGGPSMTRVRIAVVTALAAASIGVYAAPASACQPERPCPPCSYDKTWNKLMNVLGHDC